MQRNPMGAADLFEFRRLPGWTKPRGAGPGLLACQEAGEKAREGNRGDFGRRNGRAMRCSEGVFTTSAG